MNSDASQKRADSFVNTPKVQSLIRLIVDARMNALKTKSASSLSSIIQLKEKEIQSGKQKLTKQVKDMIDS